mmetsp:Transcript_12919/g.24190  ORF Transcript_12919/g.24190 Transcript_12919/m.24190 type:complete len:190 (-) Transcript_12919:28-597(-)
MEWAAEESQRMARAREKLAELDQRRGLAHRQMDRGVEGTVRDHARRLFLDDELPEQNRSQATPEQHVQFDSGCFLQPRTGAMDTEHINQQVLSCDTAEGILGIFDANLSQFNASGIILTLLSIAKKPDNFKVRRDPSFSLLLAGASRALSSPAVLPEYLVNMTWAVAKLGLRNKPLLDAISSSLLTRLS